MPARIDITGQQFSRLTVIGPRRVRNGRSEWLCRCECGTERYVLLNSLRSGSAISCGCRQREVQNVGRRTHGHTRDGAWSSTYRAWAAMIQRCTNPRQPGYDRYGGRGITVCERWRSFENFYADLGSKPTPKHQLDRIDNDGNYEPSNCRWVTARENNHNRSNTVWLHFQGRRRPLTVWAEEYQVPLPALYSRIHRGWDVERALITPVRKASRAA